MHPKNRTFDRRTVLKAAAGSLALGSTASLTAADDVICPHPGFDLGDFVETQGEDGTVFGFHECEDPALALQLENGLCGNIRKQCCKDGTVMHFVRFTDIDKALWISEENLAFCASQH